MDKKCIKDFYANKQFSKNDWKNYPIILRWLEKGSMEGSLKVINDKVCHLSQVSKSKLQEWLASDDNKLTQVTAERYILDYLRTKNNLTDIFSGGGVDAHIEIDGEKIGTEVKTLNKTTPEWLLNERLLMYLWSKDFVLKNNVEIRFPLSRTKALEYLDSRFKIIEAIGNALITSSYGEVEGFTISKLEKGSSIIWEMDNDGFNLFEYLPTHLQSIIDNKKQFKDYSKNILFIGANQIPVDHLFGMFIEMANPTRFTEEIEELENMLTETLPDNIIGVCYFHYHLPQINPYYPLKIFWKKGAEIPSINL